MVPFTSPFLRSLRLGASRKSFISYFRSLEQRDAITNISKHTRCVSSSVGEIMEVECDEPHDDTKATEKHTALHQALSELAGDFGRESMLSLQRFFKSRRAPVLSTGLLKLDLALGIGGLPKGRMVEIYGREASGKTSLALHIIREAQKSGGYCAYLDAENALNPTLLESMDVDLENLLIAYPNSAENLLNIVDTLAKTGAIDVIVVDSVAALVPQCEIDRPIGGGVYRDVQKRIMTQALRKISGSLCRSETIIIFLNQVRSNVKSGKVFLGPVGDVTCGGNALEFYSAVRLRMIRKGVLRTRDKSHGVGTFNNGQFLLGMLRAQFSRALDITGVSLCVEVVKNKLAPAMKRADVGLQFGRGFCCESEVFELACEHGLIMKEGSNYLIGGKVFSSELAAQQYLAKNPEVLDKIVLFLRKQWFQRQN